MQIILLERVEKLGQMGEEVAVKPGYARNFLLPRNKAVRATDANRERFEAQRAELEARNLERRQEAERVADDLTGLTVVLIRAASDTGRLYGSVTARDVADAVSDQGIKVSRHQMLMEKPVKTIGVFDFRVQLHPEVFVPIHVNVAQSMDEAGNQAERRAKGEDVVVTEAERDTAEEAECQTVGVAATPAELVDTQTAGRILEATGEGRDEGGGEASGDSAVEENKA